MHRQMDKWVTKAKKKLENNDVLNFKKKSLFMQKKILHTHKHTSVLSLTLCLSSPAP